MSIYDVFKLYLPTEYHEKWDAHVFNQRQRAIKIKLPAMKKYARGLVVLAIWLVSQYEDGALATSLMDHASTPKVLYKHLRQVGFVWDSRKGIWRLRKGRKAPLQITIEAD